MGEQGLVLLWLFARISSLGNAGEFFCVRVRLTEHPCTPTPPAEYSACAAPPAEYRIAGGVLVSRAIVPPLPHPGKGLPHAPAGCIPVVVWRLCPIMRLGGIPPDMEPSRNPAAMLNTHHHPLAKGREWQSSPARGGFLVKGLLPHRYLWLRKPLAVHLRERIVFSPVFP